jgi:hypothetical protein
MERFEGVNAIMLVELSILKLIMFKFSTSELEYAFILQCLNN